MRKVEGNKGRGREGGRNEGRKEGRTEDGRKERRVVRGWREGGMKDERKLKERKKLVE
jgi:hypothetical protein